MIHPTRI